MMDHFDELESKLNEKKRLLHVKERKLKKYKIKKTKQLATNVFDGIRTDSNVILKKANDGKPIKVITFKESSSISEESTNEHRELEIEQPSDIYKNTNKFPPINCMSPSVGSSKLRQSFDNFKDECTFSSNDICRSKENCNIAKTGYSMTKNSCSTPKTSCSTPKTNSGQQKSSYNIPISSSNKPKKCSSTPKICTHRSITSCSTPKNLQFGAISHYVDDDIFADCNITDIFDDIEMMERTNEETSVTEVNIRENSSVNCTGINNSCYELCCLPENLNVLATCAMVTEDGNIFVITICEENVTLWKLPSNNNIQWQKIAQQSFNHSVERAFLYSLNNESDINFFMLSISNKSTYLSMISYSEDHIKLICKSSNDVVMCSDCNIIGCRVDSWNIAIAIDKCSNICCTNAKEMRTLCLMCIDLMFSKRKNDWQLKIEFISRDILLEQIKFLQKFSDELTEFESLLLYHETGSHFGVIDLTEFVILNKFTLEIPCILSNKWSIIWTRVIQDCLFIAIQTSGSIFIVTADPSISQVDKFQSWKVSDEHSIKSDLPPAVTFTEKSFLVLFSNGSYYNLPCPLESILIKRLITSHEKI